MFLTSLCLAVWVGAAAPQAGGPVTVGLLPFDVASVEGASTEASEALAKLVRLEMLDNKSVQPELLKLPEGTDVPVSAKKAAEIGKGADVGVVLVGTVLEASTSQSSHSAGTGAFGTYVGGNLSKTSATVSVHVQLVDPASGKITDTFEVEGHASETGVGADLSTTLGSFDTGDSAWDKTPMGKALRDVARKIVAETAKRSGKISAR